MLKSYLTVAMRNLLKNRIFSAINIFGLGAGLAACLLIFQFVSYELSYDQFNEKLDRTYRVTNDRFQNGKLIQHGTIMYPTIGPVMTREFPEIETYTRMMPGGNINVKIEDKVFRGDRALFTDEHFFEVFDYVLLAGDRNSLLTDRYTLVLTEKVAKKYFEIHDSDYSQIINKTLFWGLDTNPFKITGVVKDLPENSHLQFDVLASYHTLYDAKNHDADDSWTWSDMRHYLVLKPGTDYKALESKFPEFSERHFQGDKVSGSVEKFYLQPMKEAHLYSNYEYDIARTASGKAVWSMLIVAFFIMVIAWINYINLTTSRSLDRAKEVGLRKVMGAVKSQLVKQFIFESVLISLCSVVVALGIVAAVQSSFNEIVGGNLSMWRVITSANGIQILALACIMIGGILLSGFYPAFILSSYQPVIVLKGKFHHSFKGQLLKKGLVIFQFMASTVLIVCTSVVSGQLKYMNETDLGIKLDNTLVVSGPERTEWDSTFMSRLETYRHAVEQIDGVVSMAISNRLPGDRLGRNFGIRLAEGSPEVRYTLSTFGVDYKFFDTYGVKLVAGRNFIAEDYKNNFDDLKYVMLNENAVRLLGLPSAEAAIGKEIVWGSLRTLNNSSLNSIDRLWTIVGVIGDFHQEMLRKPMEPMIVRPLFGNNAPASIRIKGDPQKIVSEVESAFKEIFPGNVFEHFFIEERYNNQYRDDNRFGSIITLFTGLAMIISCLGLIGLASYTAVQRTKEIGIRKVLGATSFNMVSLLSTDFILLVIAAALISLPLSYYLMKGWLEGYAYRISPAWYLYLAPPFAILLIAALTIGLQVLRTARANPAATLKYE